MSDTKIKALVSFSDGVVSLGVGDIATIDASKASAFISGGLAVAYTDPIVPSGSVSIGANGTYDVTNKASAVVNVTTATVTYDVNGGTGTISAAVAIKGNEINLNGGTGITPPSGKTFEGWATTNDAEAPDVTSPYKVTEDITLYAVYSVE
jgi:uncharacterized repeat protein (TIGR02543 family)